jgi:nucleoside-diphosphate-sugar epimerase
MALKPAVLIFGGLNTCSRALAALLVPLEGEPQVSLLRIVDKYSVHPPTTYIGFEFTKVLERPEVEYRQANLTVSAAVASAYDVPEGKPPFDYVFDFTGEVRHDRSEAIQINNTFTVARILALEAAKRNIKSYVRIQHPFYETSSKQPATEKDDIKPIDTIGIWWHETLRSLAAIENLNLLILRIGFLYGPYTTYGDMTTLITVAAVYGYLHRPMKSLWSPGKNPTHTVHVEDVAAAAWACANWMASHGRKEANQLAGEVIPFHNEKSKVKEVDGMIPHDQKIMAPLFNLVDDSNSTLVSTGSTISSFFGTTFEFFNLMESTVFKITEDLEDINEQHVEGWTEMLVNSSRSITNSPLNPYMDKYTLSKHVFALNNDKIKKIIGYKLLRPEFSPANMKEIVDKWKAEGVWPDATK